MEPNKKPRAREKHVTQNGKGVRKKGEGLGTGPVGASDGYSDKPKGSAGSGGHVSLGGQGAHGGHGINRAVLGGGIGLARAAATPLGGLLGSRLDGSGGLFGHVGVFGHWPYLSTGIYACGTLMRHDIAYGGESKRGARDE